MAKLWQLRKITTGENLSEPQPLPENWGPIFGMQGVADKLSNLGWLGRNYSNMGWFECGETSDIASATPADLAWNKAKQMLNESDWSMMPDVPMTSGQKADWMEYRKALREIRLQPGFPNDIIWPKRPD